MVLFTQDVTFGREFRVVLQHISCATTLQASHNSQVLAH